MTTVTTITDAARSAAAWIDEHIVLSEDTGAAVHVNLTAGGFASVDVFLYEDDTLLSASAKVAPPTDALWNIDDNHLSRRINTEGTSVRYVTFYAMHRKPAEHEHVTEFKAAAALTTGATA